MATGVQTWLSPFAAVWRSAYPSAQVPFKQLARELKPLTEAHPTERIVAELEAYLKKTPPQFLSPHRFAMTFGAWTKPEPRERRPYSQSVDEMDRNAGIIP